MSDPHAYTSSDYAGIDGGRFRFYYGYEETDEEGDWEFVAYENGEEMARWVPGDEDEVTAHDGPMVTLAKCVARYLDTHYPSLPEKGSGND